MNRDHLAYGAKLDAPDLVRLLDHLLTVQPTDGSFPPPVCIWGPHGIGKTSLVEDWASQRGWSFAYLAPAQLEEMGDLHGLPVRDGEHTRFLAPDWVPREAGPGLLLLDDLNRADERILRGLMQLLQLGRMVSWSLPEGWRIVVTANPEGGDYQVTPMDEALITRMVHAQMRFAPRAWARWARDAGVDPRGIDFVLLYPEAVTGRRTTPRTLTRFFDQIASITDLRGERELVWALASSALDDTTVASFLAFVDDDLEGLVQPDELLDAEDFGPLADRLATLAAGHHGEIRMDRLSTVATRLHLTLTDEAYTQGPRHRENLVAFLTCEALPADQRLALHRDLVREAPPAVIEMLRDARLADLMLAAL